MKKWPNKYYFLIFMALLSIFFVSIKDKTMNFVNKYRSPFGKKFPITSGFGNRKNPIGGGVEFHNGVDLATPIGSGVFAPCDGVFSTKIDSVNGLACYVSDNAIRFGWGHLSKVYFVNGVPVKKGQLIAETGNAGHSTGPHVHFTCTDIKTGKKIDPVQIVDFGFFA